MRPPVLLGEIAARMVAPLREGERCVVIGWAAGGEGRKRQAGSAVFGEDHSIRAVARATWVVSTEG
jgi:hypothetical protein